MPRKPCFTLPGVPQHVIQCGNNREPGFLAETDYHRCLEDLQTCADKYHYRLHASTPCLYVLMSNCLCHGGTMEDDLHSDDLLAAARTLTSIAGVITM